MSDPFWLTDARIEPLTPFFPLSRGVLRHDDKPVPSGMTIISRNGLRWRDAPAEYRPPKTPCNRWTRWGRLGVFAPMQSALATVARKTETVMTDATHRKAQRTASRLRGRKAGPA